jgi:hypothetical protein
MLGMGGFADFLNIFVKKLVYILMMKKFDKLFKFKYLLKVVGVNLLIFYFIREIRICASPYTESIFLKVFFLLYYSLSTFLCTLILPPTNYRANFRLELLIYNTLMLSYLLVYPTAYLTVLLPLYALALTVNLPHLSRMFIEPLVPFLYQEKLFCIPECTHESNQRPEQLRVPHRLQHERDHQHDSLIVTGSEGGKGIAGTVSHLEIRS